MIKRVIANAILVHLTGGNVKTEVSLKRDENKTR